MRRWTRYRISYADNGNDIVQPENSGSVDYTIQDFDGYALEKYSNREDFFRINFYSYSDCLAKYDRVLKEYLQKNKKDINRLVKYDKILRQYLQKDKKILSIGSGKAVNELLLLEDGYDIICSDIKRYYNDEILRLFPHLKFIDLNILSPVIYQQYDYIIALGVFFLFDNNELTSIFRNISKMLNRGGKMIFDFGGAKDNFITFIIDEFLAKYEMMVRFLIKRLKGERCTIIKKFNGYRRTDKEIISMVEKNGFKFLNLITSDCDTEITRSFCLSEMANLGGLFKRIVYKIGSSSPYIRIFIFEVN